MKQIKLNIKTKTDSYSIIIGSNLINNLPKLFKNNSITFNKCLFVIDKKIPNKFISTIIKSFKNKETYKFYFNANEKNKSQRSVDYILKNLLNKNFSRQDCVISIGGGITGDVVGLAASLYKRGLQFINIPTTLLSQVDSSIGGKTGINTSQGKNLIGTFYQPKLVISDIQFLKTLPYRELICGYGEILKHSLIRNRKFYVYLSKNFKNIMSLKSPIIEKTIYESCKIKKDIVQKDEKEKELRKVLNFGHTFAHAYEASLGYSKKLNHGEAVILGIKSALRFSLTKRYLIKKDYNSIISHIDKSNLPSEIKKYFSLKDLKKIVTFMTKDKKNNSDQINLILLKKIGTPVINAKFNKINLKKFLSKELTNKQLN